MIQIKSITKNITNVIKKMNTKKNEYNLIITLIIITILWLAFYIIPETLSSLFNTILGKLILIILVLVISYKDIKYGITLAIFIIVLYRFSVVSSKKEGFVWSQDTLQKFLKLENTINRGIVFDTMVTQKQATEKEAQYFLKNGKWPWNEKVKMLYMKSVSNNPHIRTSPEDSLNHARTIYNQTAILQVLSLQTNEGKLLLDGVLIDVSNNQMEEPYAYNSGLISKYNSIIRCNTKDKNNAVMERKIMVPNGSLNAPTITTLDYHDLENVIPGFKFINKPCNPCSALNNYTDYSCPFSLKTTDNPHGEISGVWKYLWNITPTHNPLKSQPSMLGSEKNLNKNEFPILQQLKTELTQSPIISKLQNELGSIISAFIQPSTITTTPTTTSTPDTTTTPLPTTSPVPTTSTSLTPAPTTPPTN